MGIQEDISNGIDRQLSIASSLKGKTILVTGAGKGIGRAISVQLYKIRANVIAISRDAGTLVSLKKECPEITTICLDLEDWKKTRETVQSLGFIHHLVNNAGVTGPSEDFMQITSASFDTVFGINVKSIINVSQVVVQKMIKAGHGGSIVNLSSICGLRPLDKLATYCSSKSALQMLTKAMAVELGKYKIRVNNVNPGFVKTPMVQNFMKNSFGEGKEEEILTKFKERVPLDQIYIEMDGVVNTILFLLSDMSTQITGQDTIIDGGFCAT